MSRTLNAQLLAAFRNTSGDFTIYWYIAIQRNAADTDAVWGAGITQHVFGNLRTDALASTTVFNDTLLGITNIDTKLNIYNNPLAKLGEVNFDLENGSNQFDGNTYSGHDIKIWCGTGTTLSETDAEIFFTGKIHDFKINREKLVLKARGKSELFDRMIGVVQSDNVYDKYRGKIMPITYGDHTLDDDAYMPIVIDRELRNLAEIKASDYPHVAFDSLNVYDKDRRESYRALSSQYVVNSDKNELSFFIDIGMKLNGAIDENDTKITISGVPANFFTTKSGSTSPADQIILKIGLEYILVIRDPGGTGTVVVDVDRGWGDTTAAGYPDLTIIYKVDASWANILIKIQHVFWPTGFSGWHKVQYFLNIYATPTKVSGNYNNLKNITGSVTDEFFRGSNLSSSGHCYYAYDMIFPKISISGIVTKHYILAACRVTANCTSSESTDDQIWSRIYIGKDLTDNGSSFDSLKLLTKTGTNALLLVVEQDSTGPGEGGNEGSQGDSFNNIELVDGVSKDDEETDLDLANAKKWTKNGIVVESTEDASLDNLSNLNSVRYQIVLNAQWSGDAGYTSWGTLQMTLWQVGFRIDAEVDLVKNNFFARGKGRAHPGGYISSGVLGDMIENPVTIIEDVLRRDAGLVVADLESTSISASDSARTSWFFAGSFFNNQISVRKFLKIICEQASLISWENYAGQFAVTTLDLPSSVTRQINDSEILLKSNKAAWSYDFIPSSVLITELIIKYKPRIPERGEYAGVKWIKRTGAGGTLSNFLTEESSYTSKLEESYDIIEKERPITIIADHIRDEATVEKLAKSIINWRASNLKEATLDCTYSVSDIEIGDKITITAGIIPTYMKCKTWIVTGNRMTPNVNKSPSIKLNLNEMPYADIEDCDPGTPPGATVYDWQEVTSGGQGSDIQEVVSGGVADDIQEVV